MTIGDETSRDEILRQALASLAPGTPLRDGIERILRARTGALIVLGAEGIDDRIAGGGFTIDVEFTASRLRELAKMDGAVILTADLARIDRAAVQLLPDPQIPTEETGTRHRTADRVAKQTGLPVVSVSKSMDTAALYVDGTRFVLEETSVILARANQAVATLERYRGRLDEVAGSLSALEIEDVVTVRDVALFAQRLEMVRRIAGEVDGYLVQLGVNGRLLALQCDELVGGVDAERVLLVRDYLPGSDTREAAAEPVLLALDRLTGEQLLDLQVVGGALGFPTGLEGLDNGVSARGYRLLGGIPRLPDVLADRIIEHFQSLQALLAATVADLQAVDGVGDLRARSIRDAISRVAETSILERYS